LPFFDRTLYPPVVFLITDHLHGTEREAPSPMIHSLVRSDHDEYRVHLRRYSVLGVTRLHICSAISQLPSDWRLKIIT
jgi:hypothetical protein